MQEPGRHSIVWGDYARVFNLQVMQKDATPCRYNEVMASPFKLVLAYLAHGLSQLGYQKVASPSMCSPGDVRRLEPNESERWWLDNLKDETFMPHYFGHAMYVIPPVVSEQVFVSTRDVIVVDLVFLAQSYLEVGQKLGRIDSKDELLYHFSDILKPGMPVGRWHTRVTADQLSFFDQSYYRGSRVRRYLVSVPDLCGLTSGLTKSCLEGGRWAPEEIAEMENRAMGVSDLVGLLAVGDHNFADLMKRHDHLHKLLNSTPMSFWDFVDSMSLGMHDSQWEKIRDTYLDSLAREKKPVPVWYHDIIEDDLEQARQLLATDPPAAMSTACLAMERLVKGILKKDIDAAMPLRQIVQAEYRNSKIKPYARMLIEINDRANQKTSEGDAEWVVKAAQQVYSLVQQKINS